MKRHTMRKAQCSNKRLDQQRIEYLVMPNRSERIQYGRIYFELHTSFANYFIRYEMRPGFEIESRSVSDHHS